VTSVRDLVELVPPPDVVRPDIDWSSAEASVGTLLPDDYKNIIETYGPGKFGGFLHVFQPVSALLTIELAFQARRQEEILDQIRAQGLEVIPYAPGELMAVAGTDNGDTLYWIKNASGGPGTWRITGNEARNDVWPEFSGGIAAFLYAIMSRTLRFPIFRSGFPGRRLTFDPYGPRDQRAIERLRAEGLYRDL
jgi:SMI1 / KNR4 family (SUKH-1)